MRCSWPSAPEGCCGSWTSSAATVRPRLCPALGGGCLVNASPRPSSIEGGSSARGGPRRFPGSAINWAGANPSRSSESSGNLQPHPPRTSTYGSVASRSAGRTDSRPKLSGAKFVQKRPRNSQILTTIGATACTLLFRPTRDRRGPNSRPTLPISCHVLPHPTSWLEYRLPFRSVQRPPDFSASLVVPTPLAWPRWDSSTFFVISRWGFIGLIGVARWYDARSGTPKLPRPPTSEFSKFETSCTCV